MRVLVLFALGLALSGCGGSGSGGGGAQAAEPEIEATELETTELDVMTGVLFAHYETTDVTGVGGTSCPVGTTPITTYCNCHIEDGAGDLFAFTVASDGGVCACSLPGPVDTSVICASVVMGTAIGSAELTTASTVRGLQQTTDRTVTEIIADYRSRRTNP